MADPQVSAQVAAALRRLEELARRLSPDEGGDGTATVTSTVASLRELLLELESSSDVLRSQNAELHAERQSLVRQRAWYRDLFELSPDPYLVTDDEGTILHANGQAHDLLGVTTARLQGRGLEGFVHPEDVPDYERVLGWLRQGYGMRGWELRVGQVDDWHVALVSVEPVAGEAGEAQLRWALSDATSTTVARRRLIELLDAAREDAAALRVLTDWQATLLGATAHDLRTPLAEIDACLSSALSHPATVVNDDLREELIQATAVTVRLRRLLPGLLDLGRLQATEVLAQRSDVHLPDVVATVRRLLGGRGERIRTEFAVETIRADRLQLERVLENLVRNAVRHTPDDAEVIISSEARGIDVLLTVDDPGRNVPDELRQDVFSPFTTLRSGSDEAAPTADDGFGLGLALVAMFTAMHGGRAWVERSTRGGASFCVLLSSALEDED